MNAITRYARGLARDDRGLTTVEYAIVLCLIVAVAVGIWQTFGDHMRTYLTNASNKIQGEMDKDSK